MNEVENLDEIKTDEGIKELMEDYDLDAETAERVRDIMDELGLDEDDAIELADAL